MRNCSEPELSGVKPPPSGAAPGREVHLDEWVSPHICDDRGRLRAGKILEWMDVVGVLAAVRHARRTVATVSVDGMQLLEPVNVGDRVRMTASVGYTSRRSIGVSVRMLHGLSTDEKMRRCVDGYMTFVAMDDTGELADVPQFVPETPVEVARFREGQLRREFRRKLEAGMVSTMEPFADVPPSEQPLLVRELLKRLPFRMPWDRDLRPQARHSSYMHTIEPVREQHLNFHGTLYGGTLMRWMETTASLSARAYAGSAMRLAGLHGLNFIRPVHRNVFVHIRSVVVHSSDVDLTVLVNVHSENPVDGSYDETLRAFVTYVPAGDQAPRIPPLECRSEEDRALFEEVEHRRALQRSTT